MNRGADETDNPDEQGPAQTGSSGPSGTAVDGQILSNFGAQTVVGLQGGFARSRHPMLIADDQRRWVTGNDAACKLFGISREEVPWRTMDELTAENERRKLADQWRTFLSRGAAEGWYQLDVPNRGSVPVEFSAIANVLTGRHLMVFVTPDDASIAHGRSGSERAAAWTPVAVEGKHRVQLTKRESEVMTLIAAGGRSEDIATQMFLSSETIKTHVQNALAKLGAHTRAHAVAIALVTGEIALSMFDALSSAPSSDGLPRQA